MGRRLYGEKFSGAHQMGEEVFMVEHYKEHGDDGHTDMQLTGYIFVRQSGLELIDRYGRKQFVYIETLQEIQMEKWHVEMAAKPPYVCDLCGKSDW